MNSPLEKILYRKAALIFEELGFLMPQSDFCEPDPTGGPGASVTFNGSFNGCLFVSVGKDILPKLSTNMLGQEKPANRAMEEDALGEIANVICGNALPAIYGLHKIFHLDTPVFYKNMQSLPKLSDYSCAAKLAIPFENGQANIFLYVAPKAANLPIADA